MLVVETIARGSVGLIFLLASRSRRSVASCVCGARWFGRSFARTRRSSITNGRDSRSLGSGHSEIGIAAGGERKQRIPPVSGRRSFGCTRSCAALATREVMPPFAAMRSAGGRNARARRRAPTCRYHSRRAKPTSRLEPRDRCDGRGDDDREGRARPSLPQPHDARASLSARDAGDGVRRARAGVRVLKRRLHAASTTT